MTFIKFSVAEIAPLGEEMPQWVENTLLGQPIEDSGTPILEGEEKDAADAPIPATTVEG